MHDVIYLLYIEIIVYNKVRGTMKKQIIWSHLVAILVSGLVVSACSDNLKETADPSENNEAVVGLENPAALYCEKLGYQIESVEKDGGMDADCIFPNGSRCGQWDLLSGRCGQEYTYCEIQGGSIQEGANIGTCLFSDGSSCEEYLYSSGECVPGDNSTGGTEEVLPTEEVSIQIQDFISARDYLVAYLFEHYGIEITDPWMEADITPADAAGVNTFRYVSGPLTIVMSAEASAPYPASYTIQEASYIANGFYWEGTLDLNGEINETMVVPVWSILDTDQARDAVLEYLLNTYDIPMMGDWVDEGISQTGNDTVALRYSSGSWTVLVEFAPAAPLVSNYKVIVENIGEGILWEGDISGQGEIKEISFSQ
jgi:putative hemolysin